MQKNLEIAMSATEESLSGTVQFLRDQFASMSKTLKILTAKISKIESNKKLRALTVAPKYFKPSADQVLSTSGGGKCHNNC